MYTYLHKRKKKKKKKEENEGSVAACTLQLLRAIGEHS
jgi:hypothetical protein